MPGDSDSMNFVLYADGASRGNPGPAAYGAVIFDASGNLVAELGENLGIRTNNYAEYQAVIAGLRHIETGWPGAEVLVRMDSKLVVEQLSGRWQIKHPELRELAQEAIRIIRGLTVKLEWIPREQNSLADAAANRALDDGDFGDSVERVLGSVQPKSIRSSSTKRVTSPTCEPIHHRFPVRESNSRDQQQLRFQSHCWSDCTEQTIT